MRYFLDSGLRYVFFKRYVPMNTKMYGISGTVMQTIVGNSPIIICPDITDNVLSQGWLAKNKSIMTTFNSIDNIYHIAFGIQHSILK